LFVFIAIIIFVAVDDDDDDDDDVVVVIVVVVVPTLYLSFLYNSYCPIFAQFEQLQFSHGYFGRIKYELCAKVSRIVTLLVVHISSFLLYQLNILLHFSFSIFSSIHVVD
jgi:hypothetical protein